MLMYSGKFVLTLAKGQYIGAENSLCDGDEIVLFLFNPNQTTERGTNEIGNVRVVLSSDELRAVADLIELVREATPLDEAERKVEHEHQCCIQENPDSLAMSHFIFRALQDEQGVCLKVSNLEFGADEKECFVTMTYDEAGCVADAFHKMASALRLGKS